MEEKREKKGLIVKLRRAYGVLTEHKFTTIAGTLVFFLIMSLAPFAFWVVLLFGKMLPEDVLFGLDLFDWARDLIALIRNNAEEAAAGASFILILTTLWSSTGFFYHLRRIGEIVYGVRREKKGWKVRLAAAGVTFCLILYFAVSGGILLFIGFFLKRLFRPLYYLILYSVLFLLGTIAAWMLNVYLCPYRVRFSEMFSGSLATALAWLVASLAFLLYFSLTDKSRLYGALSAVIVFLLWLYWMMICFTAGVILNCRRLERSAPEHKTF